MRGQTCHPEALAEGSQSKEREILRHCVPQNDGYCHPELDSESTFFEVLELTPHPPAAPSPAGGRKAINPLSRRERVSGQTCHPEALAEGSQGKEKEILRHCVPQNDVFCHPELDSESTFFEVLELTPHPPAAPSPAGGRKAINPLSRRERVRVRGQSCHPERQRRIST